LSHGLGGCARLTVVGGFVGGGGGELTATGEDLSVAAPVVEPVDIFEGGELDVLDALPGPVRVDEFPLVEAVERFDHRVGPRCRLRLIPTVSGELFG